ncbi:hypothetical protein [Glaciibacter psychrotolerans]|uniref:Uncharacterized protein n=1 Tax=Glaciibacter psychrotolerans TaxID=670054 RepID=A0A7Z0EC68_9MICO|nr:hypothetical protein [Leifsonia psychrotolerans]NYJ18490.1 hypothetical protein [Leifsonia psychrotolerans]
MTAATHPQKPAGNILAADDEGTSDFLEVLKLVDTQVEIIKLQEVVPNYNPLGPSQFLVTSGSGKGRRTVLLDLRSRVELAVELPPEQVSQMVEVVIKALRDEGLDVPERAVERIIELLKSEANVDALRGAMVKLPGTVSPSIARALQSTENSIRAIEDEFGLLDRSGLAEALGSKAKKGAFASDQRKKGRVLSFPRLNAFVYPGFQFDHVHGTVKPVIAPLIALGAKYDWKPSEIALWLCSPTTYLPDDGRPVDFLDDAELVLGIAQNSWGVEW